ncbi:helix-turn-helix transcriptional regulator [Mycolicibacterium fortuitum]|nr:helix-turn-helix transcriptional regulator [Mycolicibacterium fortuitum]
MALRPWNSDRPMTPRTILKQDTVASRGLSFNFVTERISAPTDWCSVDAKNHVMYVYRHGAMRSMETLLDWGPSGRVPPSAGDIWWKPAGIACAALVQGDTAGYCEVSIPGRAIGDAALIPRVKYRNPLVHHLVEEISSVAGREDTIAQLLTESAAETLRLLIIDTHTVGRRRTRDERHTLNPVTQSVIIEFLSDSLDSEIKLDSLARLVGMPVDTFIKAFRDAFHTTPYQFLLNRRIEKAKTLLITTSLSITEIGAAVGFSNPSHFATTFGRRIGVSPRAYRQSAK